MALPFPIGLPARERPQRPERLQRPGNVDRIDRPPAPLPAVPATLQPAHSSAQEARLQRTPEQQAEQQAITLLCARCLAGEGPAWHALVTGQHKRVYGICYRFTGDPTGAEDITQDVFLKVYRNLASFDAEKGSFQTWITTLTRNLLVDNYRRTRMERATDSLDQSLSADPYSDQAGPTMADRLADTQPNQEQRYAGLELKSRIQAALAKLSPELREAVILRDLEDMDYKEIAQVLRIPEGTVKSRISRGRGELARMLQRIEEQAH